MDPAVRPEGGGAVVYIVYLMCPGILLIHKIALTTPPHHNGQQQVNETFTKPLHLFAANGKNAHRSKNHQSGTGSGHDKSGGGGSRLTDLPSG